ncbi:MAG TPA: carboxypeptidase regulatory-like domain-containing protein [Thermoanaerobaculia bacterium]|jgi:hypothetical protein
MSRAQHLCFLAALVTMPVLAAPTQTSEKPIDKKTTLAPVTQRIDKSKKQLASPFDAPDTPVDKGHGPINVGPPVEIHISKAHGKKFDLRTLPFIPPVKRERPEREDPSANPQPLQTSLSTTPQTSAPTPPFRAAAAPAPLANFDGLDFANWGAGHPPDTNGDVGPQYYIQTINTSIGVFRKTDGARVAAFTFNTFMSQGNFGNLCDTNNFGDPVVLYDSFEDRWIISDFAFQLDGSNNVVNPPGNFQCVAVSMTGDPVSGGWNYYSINTTGGLGDYPKLGIWPDGLYMSANMFGYPAGAAFQNTRLFAFNKYQMYAGAPSVTVVSFDLPSDQFTVLPANARLQTGTPPPGSPNYFASVWKFLNVEEIWKFHVDWNNISLSSVTGPFDTTMGFWWEQFSRGGVTTAPTPANALDSLYPRLMVQNQYSNLGGTESLWTSHTVGAGNPTSNLTSTQSAVRYYQVNVTGGTVAPNTVQSFTFSPDATMYRFMPSVAVNRGGDMAIGYTTANATTNPAIVYAGRLAGDPVNSITQTEQLLFQGTGSQSGTCGTTCTRWGDYSAMTLDPDGCTFWYTNEYYVSNGLSFNTRIGSFAFPSCTPVGAGGTVQGTVTASGGGPLDGATVSLGARTTTTGGGGNYAFTGIPAGLYPSVTASYPGYVTSTSGSVTVTDGGTSTQNFTLTSASAGSCYTDTTQADFLGGVPTNIDLTTSPGDALLTKPDLLNQSNASVSPTGFAISNTSWAGQTFTPTISGKITRADVELFCASCTTNSPNLTVSIRATTGATPVPTGADLATATLAGFNDGGAGGLKTVTFATPFTVTAGTRYAVIFRNTAAFGTGTVAYTCSCATTGFSNTNPYTTGQRVTSTNSGATWTADTTVGGRDLNFRIYINAGYSTTGSIVSSTKDGNPGVGNAPNWSTLSWTASTPANTTLQFQVAGSNSVNGPYAFVGPDGTSATFFTTSGASIAQFNGLRYLQYKALFAASDTSVTPTLNDATVCFADVTCPTGGGTITPSQTPVCPLKPSLTATAPGGGSNYAWAITNGTITAGATSGTVTFTSGGSGSVALQVTFTDATGCVKLSTLSIPIDVPAMPTITPDGPTTFCNGGSVTLSSSSSIGNQWFLNTVPINLATSQTYLATASGSYTVQYVDANGCLSPMSSPTVVTVNPPPLATITISNAQSVNVSGSGTFTLTFNGATTAPLATGATASAVQASLNALSTIGDAGGSVAVTLNGLVYTVTFGGTLTGPQPEMSSSASAGVTAAVVAAPVCPNSPNNQASGPGGLSYSWSISNGTITSNTDVQTITYTTGASGDVLLYLTVTDGNGCSAASAPADVPLIASAPVPTIAGTPANSSLSDHEACPAEPLILTATSAGATSFIWYQDGTPVVGQTSSTLSVTSAATYTASAVASGCSSAVSANYSVTNPTQHTAVVTPSGPTTFCAGGSVTLSSSSATGIQWFLDGSPLPDPQNPNRVVTVSGTYTVTNNYAGCVNNPSNGVVVTVNPIPTTPTATPGGPTTFCAGGSVTLTSDSASGNQWLLNGSPIGGATNQTFQATANGSYSVSVTTSGCTSAASNAVVVTVNPLPPTPTITPGGPTTFCAGGSVTLTSSSATGNQWSLNGSPIGGATSQTYVATASGNYTVVVTDVNACSSAASAATSVTVNPIPATPTITPGGPTTFCAGGSVTLTSSSATGNQWSLNGSPIGGATANTYVATLNGNYTVVVTSSGCSSAASAATSVTVNSIPATPTITPDGPTTFCAGGSVTLTSSSATGNQWSLNGSPIGGGTANTYVATANGNYTVVVTTSGCSSAASAATSVTVNPIPATPTITPAGPTTFCAGGSVTLTSSSASGNEWSLNGSPIGGGTANTYVATANGNYTVVVTTSGCSSAASAAASVTVNPIPATPTITPGGPTTFCAGGSVTLTSSSATGNQWSLNGSPIGGATSQTYVATATGDYTLTVTSSGCSSAASAATTVTVNPNPDATITAPASVASGSTGNIASVANGGAGATYNWSVTDGTITGGTGTNSVTFTAGAIGTLTLQVTVTTSTSCSDTKSANVTVGIPAVTVTSVSPTSGSINGHTSVTVNGTGFQSGATVQFGTTAATSVVVVNATKITALTPAHAAGTVNVTVTNTDTSTGTLTNGYTYAQLFDPNGDHTIDPSDIFYLINYLFLHGPAPQGGLAAGDANGDGVVDPSDVFYLVNYLFLHGPQPYSEPVVRIASASAPMKGSISLGEPVLRGDRYIIPVVVNGGASAMSLRLRFAGAGGVGATIQRAAGLQPAFEVSRHDEHTLSYLVAYAETFHGVVAEIEVPSAAASRGLQIDVDPDLTLLCDPDGIRKATVAGGNLTVSGTSIDGERPRIEKPRSEQ